MDQRYKVVKSTETFNVIEPKRRFEYDQIFQDEEDYIYKSALHKGNRLQKSKPLKFKYKQ